MLRFIGVVLLAFGLSAVIFESAVIFLVFDNTGIRDRWYGFWFFTGAVFIMCGATLIRIVRRVG